MMCKRTKYMRNGIDPCLRPLIKWLNKEGHETVASCCGHGKYPMTIVVEIYWAEKTKFVEVLSGITIHRKKKFYKKDKKGFYFIPETVEVK